MIKIVSVCLFTILLCFSAASAQARQNSQIKQLAFTHATVIDVAGGRGIPDVSIIVTGERITAVGKTTQIRIPKDALVINATGKYLIPGLWDMHAHLDDPELWHVKPRDKDKETLLQLLVINGVTGVRDMGGNLKLLQGWRERIKAGTLLGPRIFACGPLLDGPKPMWDGSIAISNEAEARAAIRQLKQDGSDFAKVYSLLPREAFFAIADEAKKQGLPFAGHVPDAVTPEEASDAGIKSQEHLLQILLSSADRDVVQRKVQEMKAANASAAEIRHARIQTALATFSEERAAKLFAKFVKNDTWQTPTLIVWQANAYFEDEYPKNKDRIKYLPRYIQDYWNPANNAHLQNRSAQKLADDKLLVEKNFQIVGLMKRAGVKLMTGSDFEANPLSFSVVRV